MDELHYSPGAASLCVHWMLLDMGRPPRLKRVDLAAGEQRLPAYLALNPAGMVPTLIMDGEPWVESSALLLMLADRHPGADLLPPVGSARRQLAYQWTLLMANGLQPAFRFWFYPQEAAGDSAAVEAKALATQRIEGFFARIDAHLTQTGPYLLGEKISAPDFFLAMLCRWSRNMPRPSTEWPALGRFVTLMRSRPSFRAVCEAEGLTDWLE